MAASIDIPSDGEQHLCDEVGDADRTANDISMADFDRWLDELSERMPPVQSLPPDFSRADIYNDHD